MGHKEIRTTQIYAKIVDKKKKEAAERARQDYYLQGFEGQGTQGRMREESLNIEIVDDEWVFN